MSILALFACVSTLWVFAMCDEATTYRIEGTLDEKRKIASMLAAEARVAIHELRRHTDDEEIGDHVRNLLRRIEEALNE